MKANADATVTDEQMKQAATRFPHNIPVTKEGYLDRVMFASYYPEEHAAACVPGGPTIACSTAHAITWEATFQVAANQDPSGRSVV